MTSKNPVIEAILSRRSVREFKQGIPDEGLVNIVLEAGIWAPSGLNNQPWRFIVVRDPKIKEKISGLTRYSRIIKAAPVLIAVFIDQGSSYNRDKDLMAMGACHENMLLAAHSLGLGGVWLGEILKSKDEVRLLLKAPETWELTAVLAIGHPIPRERNSNRKPLSEVAFNEQYGTPLSFSD